MGVLNVTPDSFSDGGRYFEGRRAVEHGLRMIEEGAAIVDVGGESTRPGSLPVSAAEELERVIPVISALRAASAAVISIDTSKPEVMRAAAAAGAGLINDVRALGGEGAMAAAVESGCAVCLMHMKGEPRTMQHHPRYADVVQEVGSFLQQRARDCLAAGLSADRILIDPGFGFGKTVEHNLQLLRHLREVRGDWPLLAGLSRKSTVGHLTGRPPEQRVYGSIALAVIAVMNGASIVRVHDVAPTVDALKMVAAVSDRESMES